MAASTVEVQRAAYRVEADLIGFDGIPPLHETAGDVEALDLVLLGAHDDGRLVGLVGYRRDGDTVDIDRLAVHPDHHRKGIGAALLRQVHLIEATATAFEVSTGEANLPAVALYERLGYRSTGTAEIAPGTRVRRLRRHLR